MKCQAVFQNLNPGTGPSYVGTGFLFVPTVYDPDDLRPDKSIPNCYPGDLGLTGECTESGGFNEYGWACVPRTSVIVDVPPDGIVNGQQIGCSKCTCNCVSKAQLLALQSAADRAIDCKCPCAGSPNSPPIVSTNPNCDGECITEAQLLALQAAAANFLDKSCL